MRKLVILTLIFISWQAAAQEKLMPVMPIEKDSSEITLERQILYRQLLSGSLPSKDLILQLDLPKFDLSTAIAQQRYNFNAKQYLHPGELQTFSFDSFDFYASPFLRNGAIFSGSSYQLNDKFKMGGYSFGTNSVLSAPLPNQGMNKFDTRGATMFFQYKVSKNIKIETRVSVTQGGGSGF